MEPHTLGRGGGGGGKKEGKGRGKRRGGEKGDEVQFGWSFSQTSVNLVSCYSQPVELTSSLFSAVVDTSDTEPVCVNKFMITLL